MMLLIIGPDSLIYSTIITNSLSLQLSSLLFNKSSQTLYAEVLCKSFSSALLNWEQIKKIIFYLPSLQQCYEIIKIVINQILLEKNL